MAQDAGDLEDLEQLGNVRNADAIRDQAWARITIRQVERIVSTIHEATTAIPPALDKLTQEIASHRAEVKAAGEAADRASGRLVWATWVLAGATVGLVIATGVLVYVTFTH